MFLRDTYLYLNKKRFNSVSLVSFFFVVVVYHEGFLLVLEM